MLVRIVQPGIGRKPLLAIALLAVVSTGCTSGLREIYHDVPPDESPQPAYPTIGVSPPARPTPVMTEEERQKAEAELKALAERRQRGGDAKARATR